MVPVLTLYDADFRAYADVDDFDLDMAFGSDENDFTLTVRGPAQPVPHGYVGIVGAEYGGVVDSVRSKREGRTRSAVYSGRTWHGIMDSKVLCPDAGQSHIAIGGAARDVLAALIARAGLEGAFIARDGGRELFVPSQNLDRFATCWAAVRKALAGIGCRCALTLEGSAVEVSAVPVSSVEDDAGGSVGFDVLRAYRPVNHLIGLGSGELQDRAVVHWYADAAGALSRTQTLFGVDERAEVYEYSSAGAEELDERTRDRLAEMQGASSASVEVEEARAGIGDTATARDDELGIEVGATVEKVIVKASGGALTVEYETGGAAVRPGKEFR